MDNKRIILAVVCAFVIIALGVYLALNWNDVFVTKIEFTYPDGCIEKFENGVAVTPICTQGRIMKEEQDNKYINGEVGQDTLPEFDFYNTEE